MSNSVPMSPYAQQPNVDMNGLLVATCRPDQSGAYPPIYNVPHGTIQLAPGYNALPGGASWPFQMAPVAEQQGSGQDVQSVSGSYPPFGETVPSTPQRGQDARKASVPNTPNAATSGQPSVSGTAPSEQPRSGKGPATEDPTDSGESTEGRPGQRKRTLAKGEKDSKTGRRKIKIEFIDDDSRRHITFSKRKAGIMKKVLLLVVSQTGLVYTFTTPKLEAIVKQPEGRNLIQECLNAPGPSDEAGPSAQSAAGDMYAKEEGEELEEGEEEEEEEDDVAELSQADASLTAQAFTASPLSEAQPYPQQPNAPLFHPGWAAPNVGKRADYNQGPIKRRRTQPNLSAAGLPPNGHPSLTDLRQAYYPPVNLPTMPVDQSMNESQMMSNRIPMYYAQPLPNEECTPHLPGQANVAQDLPVSSQPESDQQNGNAAA